MNGYESTFDYKLIYIFAIHDEPHKGLLKIGETTLDSNLGQKQLPPNCDALNSAAHHRIKQYTQTALIEYDLLYTELAVIPITMNDGSQMTKSFSDDDVHYVLDNSGYRCQKFHDNGYDSEWYEVDLQTAINAIHAFKDGRDHLYASEKSIPSTGEAKEKIKKKITLRDEQQDAVIRTLAAFKKGDTMLWNCKMRFGKTVSAYELVRRAGFQKTIVVTHRPVVEEGWKKDHDLIFDEDSKHLFVTKKINGSEYEYDASIDSENNRILKNYASKGESFVYFASMQDLRGSEIAGGKFRKNEAVFDMDWDCIIYDEAHEGTQTEKGQTVQELLEKPKNGKKPKVLSLSGTPYNILEQYDDNVYTWDYVMEQQRKKEFAEQHPGEHNPYADLPEMRILTFDLNKSMPTSYRYETEDMAFNFREFFRTWTGDFAQDLRQIPDGAKVGDFVHEADVNAFLDLISTEDPDTNFPFASNEHRDLFRHTFWMVPGVKEARALSELLRNHPVFQNYGIANVAGDGDQEEKYDDALKKVQDTIRTHKFSITISCGKLTTGVTVPEWSAVMMPTGSASTAAAGYMQTIFRVQSVGCVDGKQKEVAYVFDFAPDRALKVLSEVHSLSKHSRLSDGEAKKALGEFINFCPIISVEGTKMQAYDVSKMMRQIKKITVDKAVKSGFDDESIYNEGVGIVMDESDVKIFQKLADVVSGQSKAKTQTKVTINNQGMTNEEYEQAEKASNKPKRQRTPEEEEALKKLREAKKEQEKVIRLLRAVSIRLPMLIYGADVELDENIGMAYFIERVDDESWKEFMPDGVSKDLFRQLLKYYDEDVVVGAGLRIRHLAKAADELPPTRRVQRIAEIFATFRNPDKETVLTPWRVVNMHMGDCIGGYNFYKEGYPQGSDGLLETPRLIENDDVTEDLFLNPKVRILEMNSKSGLYPLYLTYSLYAMKLSKPESQVPLEEAQKLWQETLEENIYVLCKTKMAVSITRRTLAGYQDNWQVNILYLTHLLDRMQDKPRLSNKLTNPTTWNKEGDKMKFDAIVGNPPYQLTGGSGGTNDSPIYQEFATLAEEIEPNYISLIIPSRWFSGGRENLLANFRKTMLENKNIRKMYAYVDSQDVFPSVEIKGGICYYLYDKNHKGTCDYTLIQNGSRMNTERNLGDFDVLIREPVLSNIVKKVMSQAETEMTVDTIISGDTPFGIPTNPQTSSKNSVTVYEESSKSHDTELLYLNKMVRTRGYICKEDIKKNADDIDKYKVFVPKASGSGTDPYVVGTPEIGNKNSVCSQTFLYAAFDSLNDAQNFVTYLKTKFFRVLVSACKISQEAPSKVYRFVPLQDFSKPWTDAELYAKYGLSQEEIEFVEGTIRGWSEHPDRRIK